MKTPVAIIEDLPLLREALPSYLNAQPGFDCTAVAESVEEFFELLDAGATSPRLVLSDIGLPGNSGIEGIPLVRGPACLMPKWY